MSRRLESFAEYIKLKPMESFIVYVLFFAIFGAIVYLLNHFALALIVENKWYLIAGLLPAALVFVISAYLASYGKSEFQFFNPGVYLLTLFTVLIIFGVLTGVDYAGKMIVELKKNGGIDARTAIIIVGVITGLVVVHWCANYGIAVVKLLFSKAKSTVSVRFMIEQLAELSVYITHLEFVNTSTGATLIVDPDKFIYSNKNKAEPIFSSALLIPREADFLRLSWYSFTDMKYYTDDFPFKWHSYELLPDSSRVHDITGIDGSNTFMKRFSFLFPKRIKGLLLKMKENGDLDLNQRENIHYYYYVKVVTAERSEQEFSENLVRYKTMLKREQQDS